MDTPLPMEFKSIENYLKEIRVPEPGTMVYKEECIYSFDTPFSETGLYVCLTSFFGVGKDFLKFHSAKYDTVIYLYMKFKKIYDESPTVKEKPSKLAIGIEGGFDPSSDKKFTVEKYYEIVLYTEGNLCRVIWPNKNLPEFLSNVVNGILNAESVTTILETQAAWNGDVIQTTKFADGLVQLDTGKKIPPSGWKCENCDLTTNLWLNLTDGSIHCGRKFFDGSGGNNHAVEHFNLTNYPLAVKLGTISKDGKADVFSYIENDMVEDPHLAKHLAHFGINMGNMEKTDKSMIELEVDLNQKFGEWSTIQEAGKDLKPLYGSGYTGLMNLGNSCYMNSAMQVLFAIPDFVKKYVNDSEKLLEISRSNPVYDFDVQMSKLGNGLLSGKYSKPPAESENLNEHTSSISPQMFKNVVGKDHFLFSTKNQQDVQEFFLHLLALVQAYSKEKNLVDPSDCFKIIVEDKFQCLTTSKVMYVYRTEYCLPLSIPIEAAVNKSEIEEFEKNRSKDGAAVGDSIRPKVKLSACLDVFVTPEIIQQFYSSAIKSFTDAQKTTKIKEFPPFLVIHLKKYYLANDWTPKKLDVSVEMPDILDLELLRGTGVQPGEELLPVEMEPPPKKSVFQYDSEIMTALLDMGYPENMCKRALFFTKNRGSSEASDWIMANLDDPNIGAPFEAPQMSEDNFVLNESTVELVVSMGFSKIQAIKALKKTNNVLEPALDWLFQHQEEEMDVDYGETVAAHTGGGVGDAAKPDEAAAGAGNSQDSNNSSTRYQLKAFISHMGSSTYVGHYVCHIFRDGQWVIYNDEKVAVSENPPKDLGYLYFYERI